MTSFPMIHTYWAMQPPTQHQDSFLDFMGDQDEEVNGYESILTPNTPAVQKGTEIMDYLAL